MKGFKDHISRIMYKNFRPYDQCRCVKQYDNDPVKLHFPYNFQKIIIMPAEYKAPEQEEKRKAEA